MLARDPRKGFDVLLNTFVSTFPVVAEPAGQKSALLVIQSHGREAGQELEQEAAKMLGMDQLPANVVFYKGLDGTTLGVEEYTALYHMADAFVLSTRVGKGRNFWSVSKWLMLPFVPPAAYRAKGGAGRAWKQCSAPHRPLLQDVLPCWIL